MSERQTLGRGRKLIELYRRGVGGERDNAGRLLLAWLTQHDLTLYDLDPSLPVSRDLAALDEWRQSAAWLSQLGSEAHEEALLHLVDADDLTVPEMSRLLEAVDLDKLMSQRIDGWAHADAADLADYIQAARQLPPAADWLGGSGSLASRLHAAVRLTAWRARHPARLLKTRSTLETRFVLGLVRGLGAPAGQLHPQGVEAHLSVAQLARLRALLATHLPSAEAQAYQAAEQLGEELGLGG
ncbi:hypothetical protein ACFP81_12645 [Deinococcus lacus]|uniref:Uncharacterized protein n=1 Tax=Deinococcus lacus TaxID=392561 RepID=A0ABW1YIR8_9DEIO